MQDADDITKVMKFLRCKECWEKLGREIKYCSRYEAFHVRHHLINIFDHSECQKSDWKPSHKAICGKPYKVVAASDSVLAPSYFTPIVGPAVAGFERSTALSYLISQICLRPSADYLIKPTLESEIAIDFGEPEVKK